LFVWLFAIDLASVKGFVVPTFYLPAFQQAI